MYLFKSPNLLPSTSSSFAATGVITTLMVCRQVDVFSLNVSVKTSPTGTPTVVTFYNNPVAGSNVGQIVLGTVTIPVGATAGKLYLRNIRPTSCPVGSEIQASVTTASGAGAGQAFVVVDEDPESDSNSVNVVVVTA